LFVVIGLNHKTPLAYREQIAINASNLSQNIRQIQQLPGVFGCALLSTCNRTEIYAHVDTAQEILTWFAQQHLVLWPQLQSYLYTYEDEAALAHALKVASGLDSMLLGEPQILGQLKQAFHLAKEQGCMDTGLQNWFEFIFHTAKHARHESGISEHPISVASVAVDCILQQFPRVDDKTVLLIGSGETARLAAIHLQEHGCKQFKVTSRHLAHAEHLAQLLEGQAFAVTELAQHLPQVDIVVTATSCPFPFITASMMKQAMQTREHQKMVMVDLAVPRDIEADVAFIPGICLINIDHLQEIQAQHQSERDLAGKKAQKILQEALPLFAKKQKTLEAQSLICDYRANMQALAKIEVARAQQKLASGQCQHQVLEELAERLIKKLTHYPTVGMQQAACEDRQDLLELAHYLFNLQPSTALNS